MSNSELALAILKQMHVNAVLIGALEQVSERVLRAHDERIRLATLDDLRAMKAESKARAQLLRQLKMMSALIGVRGVDEADWSEVTKYVRAMVSLQRETIRDG